MSTISYVLSQSDGIYYSKESGQYGIHTCSLNRLNPNNTITNIFNITSSTYDLYNPDRIDNFISYSSGIFLFGRLNSLQSTGGNIYSTNVIKWNGATFNSLGIPGGAGSTPWGYYPYENRYANFPGCVLSSSVGVFLYTKWWNKAIQSNYYSPITNQWSFNASYISASYVTTCLSCSDGVYVGGVLRDTNNNQNNIALFKNNVWNSIGNENFSFPSHDIGTPTYQIPDGYEVQSYSCNTILSYSNGLFCSFNLGGLKKWNGTDWNNIITSSVASFYSASDGIYYCKTPKFNTLVENELYSDMFVYRWNGAEEQIIARTPAGSPVYKVLSASNGFYYTDYNYFYSSSFNSYPTTFVVSQTTLEVPLKWSNFSSASNDFALNSASYDVNFNGTNEIHTVTMMAHAEKGDLNHSNNPTYIKYDQDINSPVTSKKSYYEYDKIQVKNITKYNYDNYTGSLEKQTYISKIGIYDEQKNLIAIAKLAKPVRKTENRDFTFKLKLDI